MVQSSKVHLGFSCSHTAGIAKPGFIAGSFFSPCSKCLAMSILRFPNTPNPPSSRGHVEWSINMKQPIKTFSKLYCIKQEQLTLQNQKQ